MSCPIFHPLNRVKKLYDYYIIEVGLNYGMAELVSLAPKLKLSEGIINEELHKFCFVWYF